MIPAPFEYRRVDSVDEAIQALSDGPDAKLLAGGHSLLPLMKVRLARPSLLVDISRLEDLKYVKHDGDRVAIGALTRHHDVANSEVLQELCPIVSYAAGEIGDPQVRHVGTIGGSVAHADPASDMPSVLTALDAELVVRGPGGVRNVRAGDFFKGLFEPDLATDEVLTEIRDPSSWGRGSRSGPRPHDDGSRLELPEVPAPRAGLGARGCRRARAERRGTLGRPHEHGGPADAGCGRGGGAGRGRRSGRGVGASRGGDEPAE